MKKEQNSFDSITALAIGLAAILGVVAAAVTTAHAGECVRGLNEVSYPAAFNWKTGAPKMKIQIGKGANSEIVAQIVSGKECKAVCKISTMERDENTFAPLSMNLDCRGNSFDELNSPAQLIWATTKAGDPEIRIGTWLKGYERASLHVEVDHYKELSLLDRVIA